MADLLVDIARKPDAGDESRRDLRERKLVRFGPFLQGEKFSRVLDF